MPIFITFAYVETNVTPSALFAHFLFARCVHFACHLQFFLEHGLLEIVLFPSLRWKTKCLDDQQILGQRSTEASGSFWWHSTWSSTESLVFLWQLNARSKHLVKILKYHFLNLTSMRYFCTSQSSRSTSPINLLYLAIRCGWGLTFLVSKTLAIFWQLQLAQHFGSLSLQWPECHHSTFRTKSSLHHQICSPCRHVFLFLLLCLPSDGIFLSCLT